MSEPSYTLLDSGNFAKLEDIGGYLMVRPCPQAVWAPRLDQSQWLKARDTFQRDSSGGGRWQHNRLPAEWDIQYGGQAMRIKPTSFGHVGLFAEQAANWEWLQQVCSERPGINTLNLFAYTGGSSIAMARGQAQVTHVDAAKGIVDWAKLNAERNSIGSVRWIVDDALKFLEREIRRERRYHGIVLDPPTYGRGPKGEIFKIEETILPLMKMVRDALDREPAFVLFSCHTPHFTPKALENLAFSIWGESIHVDSFEMTVTERSSRRAIPSGFCCRITF